MKQKVYILLPVHNRCKITAKFISCLAAQSYTNYHLILIDDGSTDGTEDMVKETIKSLTVIKGNGSWWWAGSLQQGINWLYENKTRDDDIVLFMNDDVIFDSYFLENSVDILKVTKGLLLPQLKNENTGLVEETGIEVDLKKLRFRIASNQESINCLPTRGLFLRMMEIRMIGNFFPKLLPHYLSDYEYTIRAYRKGIKLNTSPDILITFDAEATGYRNFDGLTLFEFLKIYFSKKSVLNPVYWTIFVILTAKGPYAAINIIKIWLNTIKLILSKV